jgi:membrane-bound lytic murein transglycosylase D
MKMIKLFLSAVIVFPLAVAANVTVNDSIPPAKNTASDIKFLNYDKNIDSLVSTLYAQPIATENPMILTEADSAFIYADRADTFYINRLKQIPSVVPLTYNNVVKKFIEVYTIKKRDKLEEILGLKEYYFPLFEEILDKFDMPLELKYLSVIESALNPRAVSHCGATGLWQFMYGTGRLYKLEVNSFVDERRDPIAETYAAARFLKDLYSIYHDWVLVIAAYNCGPGNVNKAIRRSGGKTNYWDIYSYLPKETRGYVPAYIAATYAVNFYKDHNLTPKPANMPFYCDTLMIRENVHLQQVADVLKLPVELIRNLNPQYRRDIIPGRYSAGSLMLPAQYATRYIEFQDSIVKYKNAEFFANDFKVINPMTSRYGGYIPPSGNMKKVSHVVKSGETLNRIAEIYQVKVADLKYWNDLSKNTVRSGKKLTVYVPRKSGVPTEVAVKKNAVKETETNVDYIYYEVKSGDTIWKIANLYQGVTQDDLIKWNNLASGSSIHPGQTIKIKKVN